MAPRSTLKWPFGDAGLEMHARLDHRLAAALAGKARLNRRQDFIVGDLEFLDIEAVEIGDVDRRQQRISSPSGRDRTAAIKRNYVYTLLRLPGKSTNRKPALRR